MNIFYLDRNPWSAAQDHCDRHLVKMCVEYGQILSTAHHVCGSFLDLSQIYKPTHQNHPSSVWARSSTQHYQWLWGLFWACHIEFKARRGKEHGSNRLVELLQKPPRMPNEPFVPPPQCMPDEFKGPCTVSAYRRYYAIGKAGILSYNWGRSAPWWLEEYQCDSSSEPAPVASTTQPS